MIDQKTIEEVSLIAARAAIEHLEKEKQQQKKTKRDRRLRNTRLLLKHYRSMKEHCGDIKGYLDNQDSEGAIVDLDAEYLAVHSITRSKKRTQTMILFLESMLEVYRINCERSENSIHLRQYKTMQILYISDEPMTIEQIAIANQVDIRTVYRDSKEAVYSLSCLIFGVDGIRMIE